MNGAVEEGAARQLFRAGGVVFGAILEDDRQRVVAGSGLGRVADRAMASVASNEIAVP